MFDKNCGTTGLETHTYKKAKNSVTSFPTTLNLFRWFFFSLLTLVEKEDRNFLIFADRKRKMRKHRNSIGNCFHSLTKYDKNKVIGKSSFLSVYKINTRKVVIRFVRHQLSKIGTPNALKVGVQ